VHHLATKETHPIVPPSNPPETAYAAWAPTGQRLAFVRANDLYVLPSPEYAPAARPRARAAPC
jgi:dipeptidyl aminopeptidase